MTQADTKSVERSPASPRAGRIGAGLEGGGLAARSAALDGLRGLAIALMGIDHAALVFGAPDGVREILTRLAVPLFMALAGYLWRPGFRWRYLDVLIVALATAPMLAAIGGATVPILFIYLGTVPALWISRRAPALVLLLCFVQVNAWPVGWFGYEPGYVLGCMVVGQWARASMSAELDQLGEPVRWLAPLGRWPLTFYGLHLAALAAFVSL